MVPIAAASANPCRRKIAEHFVDGLGGARDEQAAGGLRIGQQRALDLGPGPGQVTAPAHPAQLRADAPVTMPARGELEHAGMQRNAREVDRRAGIRRRGTFRAGGPAARIRSRRSARAPTGIAPNAMPGVLSCVVLASIAA